jgi:hypothetical protein
MATNTAPANDGEITGNVLLYSKPEPLTVEQHGKLGFNRSATPFGFAAKTHVAPLVVTEFAPASMLYPIIFAGDDFQPLAVMSLRPDENLFIREDGSVDVDTYIPAYIRRYPFVFANDDQNQRLVVCIDRASTALVEGGDTPLFEKGEATQFTKDAIEFCRQFEEERQRTEMFSKLLQDLGLLELKKAEFTPRNADGTLGETQQVAEYYAVSEEKLNALPDDKILELQRNGALAQIYAHLISLLNWDRLIAVALAKAAELEAQGLLQ